jgi:hypothetical protein
MEEDEWDQARQKKERDVESIPSLDMEHTASQSDLITPLFAFDFALYLIGLVSTNGKQMQC